MSSPYDAPSIILLICLQRHPCHDGIHLEEVPLGLSATSVTLHSLALPFLSLDTPDVHRVSSHRHPKSTFVPKPVFRCRGLKVLVDLLDEDYTEQSELVIHALNGICSVFELQSPTTKNDFCRMFIREGLLDPLSAALLNIMASQGEMAGEMNRKIVQIILVFCQVSQSDIHVRNALGTRKVVRRTLVWFFRRVYD